MNPEPAAVDPTNPQQKFYSGIASMTVAVLSLFIFTNLLAPVAVVLGIVAVVVGNKRGNRRLRGEGIIGLVLGSALTIAMLLL